MCCVGSGVLGPSVWGPAGMWTDPAITRGTVQENRANGFSQNEFLVGYQCEIKQI